MKDEPDRQASTRNAAAPVVAAALAGWAVALLALAAAPGVR